MESIAELVRKLRKLLRHRGRSADEADDLIQEAFLRLQAYRRERDVRMPEAFMVRTVQNLSVDISRRQRARGLHVTVDSPSVWLVDPAPAPDEVLTAQQRLQHLRAGLEALPPRTREVILLNRLEGYSHAQIADELGITVSAVEKHVAKAALFLSDWMNGDLE